MVAAIIAQQKIIEILSAIRWTAADTKFDASNVGSIRR